MTSNQLLGTRGKADIIRLFWLGFIIFTLTYFLSISVKGAPSMLFSAVEGMAILLLVSTSLGLIQNIEGPAYFKILFTFYIFWLLFVLLRGFRLEFDFIQRTFLNAFEGGLYIFVPLIVLFSKGAFFYKKMFDVISFLGIIFIIYCVLYFRLLSSPDLANLDARAAIEYSAKILSIPSAFILLTRKYHSKNRNWTAIVVLVLTLIFSIIRARRSLIFITGFPLILSLGLYLFDNPNKKGGLLFKLLFIISLFFIIFIYITSLQHNDYGIFSSLISRANDDTRSGVEYYFIQDMTPRDWIIGKGITGQYYYPYAENLYRSGIETEYFNIILKGGIVSLGLMLLILIPAIIKGIFYSKNSFSKAAGIWILLYVLCLYPSPMTKFILFYILVWASVGICYSTKFRGLTDEMIIQHIRRPRN